MNTYWYIVKVLPGKERQLVDHLNQQIELKKIKNIIRFVCPTEKELVVTKKKKIFRDKVIYTGYLYFEATNKLEEFELKEISNIPNIMGMMGDKTPILMKKIDVEKIIKDELLEDHIESKRFKFIVGEEIVVSEGPFTGFNGTISEINGENVEVIVKIFGRDNKISLTLSQIKK